jgi:hypothetical protein
VGTAIARQSLKAGYQVVQRFLPGARVVRTVNHFRYHDIEDEPLPAGHRERRALAVAGDDRHDAGGRLPVRGPPGVRSGRCGATEGVAHVRAGDADLRAAVQGWCVRVLTLLMVIDVELAPHARAVAPKVSLTDRIEHDPVAVPAVGNGIVTLGNFTAARVHATAHPSLRPLDPRLQAAAGEGVPGELEPRSMRHPDCAVPGR